MAHACLLDLNKNESKIVRANALLGLSDLCKIDPGLKDDFEQTVSTIEHEMIPYLQARIRKLRSTKN